MNQRTSILSLIVGLTACTGTEPRKDPPPITANVPAALASAHKAYLEGDFTAVSERIRDVLLDPTSSELVKENAYALLDKSYEARGGKLPSSVNKPSEPFGGRLQYGHIRGQGPNGPSYQAFFRGPIRDASRITQIVVVRLPNEVVLDKKAGKGKFRIKHDTPGFEDFNMDTGRIDVLPADGVFTTRIELDDGTVSEGWFITHDLTSSSSPELRTPAPSESTTDPNPRVSWSPFRTPQFASYEAPILGVYVSDERDDSSAWDLWTNDAKGVDVTEVRIGDHPGTDKKSLSPGDYWVTLSMSEERQFGPYRLVRAARTGSAFHVVR